MFPYFFLFPIWLAVSLVLPVVQSLHALLQKDGKETRMWLYYWVGYCLLGVLFATPGLETVVRIPFTVLGTVFVDIYYEAQIAAVVLLINPKHRFIDKVISLFEAHGEPAFNFGVSKVKQVIEMVEEKIGHGAAAAPAAAAPRAAKQD